MIRIITALVLAYGIYELITSFVTVPSPQAVRSAARLSENKGVKEELYETLIKPIEKAVSKLIRIESYKREKLRRDLNRAGLAFTPEMYYAHALVKAACVMTAAMIMIAAGLGVLGYVVGFLALLMYFQSLETVKDRLKERDEAIKQELPRFVRMYSHSKGDNVGLLEIVEKYRIIAGKEFIYDLDVLIMDLKTTSEETALINFEERVSIPQLTNFVNILLGSIKGEDQGVALQLMEGEMRALSRENIRRIMNSRPGKVKRATIVTGIMLLLLYLYPIGMELYSGLAVFW